jgi:hypothetical protein
MKLLKVKDGLLETENFFLVSPFNDFAGEALISRDISLGLLNIKSNNRIERQFNYSEFLIEVEKENFTTMTMDDYSMIYLSDDNYLFGIRDEDLYNQSKYWKILRMDDHVQAYVSNDGINYTHLGGMEISGNLTKQGFMKYSDNDFILKNYKLYANPYVTIQNFPENTLCELYDSSGTLLKSRVFDNNLECKVYLDNNNLQGYFTFKDANDNLLYTTDVITLCYGDTWIISPYNLEILYMGNVVTDINPALLKDLDEVVNIKNIDTKNYTNLVVGTETSSNDLIELSLDGITYNSTVTIDLMQNEEKNIYIRITKNVDNHNFKVRDFQLVINQ